MNCHSQRKVGPLTLLFIITLIVEQATYLGILGSLVKNENCTENCDCDHGFYYPDTVVCEYNKGWKGNNCDIVSEKTEMASMKSSFKHDYVRYGLSIYLANAIFVECLFVLYMIRNRGHNLRTPRRRCARCFTGNRPGASAQQILKITVRRSLPGPQAAVEVGKNDNSSAEVGSSEVSNADNDNHLGTMQEAQLPSISAIIDGKKLLDPPLPKLFNNDFPKLKKTIIKVSKKTIFAEGENLENRTHDQQPLTV